MAMFGNRGMLRRATRAVEPSLGAGEAIEVIVYLRDLHFSLGALFGASALAGQVDAFLLSLTDRRVIVHEGDDVNLARSRLLGAMARDRVTAEAVGSRQRPTHLIVRFATDEGHRFEVPLVWRSEAGRLVEALARPG